MVRIDDFGHIMAIEYANNVQQQECSGRQVDIFQCANNTQQIKACHLNALELTLLYTVFVQLPTQIKFRPKAVIVPATDAPRYMGI